MEIKKAINEIDNENLIEDIKAKTVENLKKLNEFEDYSNLKTDMGYLYYIPEHGLEALFKIFDDKKTVYYAIQGEELFRAQISDELYKKAVNEFSRAILEPEFIDMIIRGE